MYGKFIEHSGPLLDRMEIIRIPGYRGREIEIADKYLILNKKANGLKSSEIE